MTSFASTQQEKRIARTYETMLRQTPPPEILGPEDISVGGMEALVEAWRRQAEAYVVLHSPRDMEELFGLINARCSVMYDVDMPQRGHVLPPIPASVRNSTPYDPIEYSYNRVAAEIAKRNMVASP